MISVVVAEPDKRVREHILVDLIDDSPGIEIVGQARTGSEAIDLVRELQPDVLITDLAMPELSGLEITWKVRGADLPTRVLLFAAHYSDSFIVQAFDCGVAGYLLKGKADERLVEAIRTVADGERVFSDGVVDRSLEAYVNEVRQAHCDLFDTLTDREREILFLITQALDTADIADRLSISSRTVEKHLEHMYAKLDLSSQLELMRYGFQQGLIPLPQVEPG